MSEDIVERLRQRISAFGTDRDRADAADEIERLRAEVYDALKLVADYEFQATVANTNLTEALRLMEPVAEAEEATHWPYVVTVVRDDARAIAAFVKRMKGE